MKKIFTFFCVAFLAVTAFAQPPKTVLYLCDQVPFLVGAGTHDTEMFDIIAGLGYNVTAEALSATGTTSGYDCVFISESPASGNSGWVTYKEAPMPMVMGKVWAIKGPALGWVVGENDPVDYGNCADSIFVKVNDHDIITKLGDSFGIVNGGSTEGAIGAFVNFSVENPSGVNVICAAENNANQHTLVAIDKGSAVNGTTLKNDVVILGIHQVAYDELNSNAITLIDNCLKHVLGIEINPVVDGIENEVALDVNVYPNPSTDGMVTINFNQHVPSAQVSILSLDGRTVRTEDIYNAESVNLNLSDMNSGIYILNIAGTDISFTQKISLQN